MLTVTYVLQKIVVRSICTRNTWRTVPAIIWWHKKKTAENSFRAGARVLALQKCQEQNVWHRMVSYKMRIHTWPLDGMRKFARRSRRFRMPTRDMAITCLSWWESPKIVGRSWHFQNIGRPHLGHHVVCWMHAPHLREKWKSLERSSEYRAPSVTTMHTC